MDLVTSTQCRYYYIVPRTGLKVYLPNLSQPVLSHLQSLMFSDPTPSNPLHPTPTSYLLHDILMVSPEAMKLYDPLFLLSDFSFHLSIPIHTNALLSTGEIRVGFQLRFSASYLIHSSLQEYSVYLVPDLTLAQAYLQVLQILASLKLANVPLFYFLTEKYNKLDSVYPKLIE